MNLKPINTMIQCIKANMLRMKQLARAAWEKAKHAGGAFLNRIYVDMRTGLVYYDCMDARVLLFGWKISRELNVRLMRFEWQLINMFKQSA